MFAKSTVFFFALAAFVNAAPVTDYRVPIELGPGPVKIQPFPDTSSSKREPSSDLAANLDFGILFKRSSVDVDLGFNEDVGTTLPGLKRQGLDSLATQLSNLVNQNSQGQGEVINEQGQGEVSNEQGQGEVINEQGPGSKRGLDADEPVADPASAGVNLGSDGHVSVALPGFKRQDLGFLSSDQFGEGVGHGKRQDLAFSSTTNLDRDSDLNEASRPQRQQLVGFFAQLSNLGKSDAV